MLIEYVQFENFNKALNQNSKIMKTLIITLSVLIFFGFQIESLAQTRATLTQEEIDAIDVLYESNLIIVRGDGWEINPDLWSVYNFTQRKNLTEKLAIRFKQLARQNNMAVPDIIMFYNMATKKKIARWYKSEYKEF